MSGKNNPFYGRKHNKKSIEQMRKSHKRYLKLHPRKSSWNKGIKMPKHSKEMFGNKFRKGKFGHKMSIKTRKIMSKSKTGVPWSENQRKSYYPQRHPMWKGGKSYEPYTFEFNKELKLKIRKRDRFKCQLCGMAESKCIKKSGRVLSVNHIDFNKSNCSESNLNTLCVGCNSFVNKDREKWTLFFSKKMKNEKSQQLS
jgi:hypothetical protein